MCDYCDCRSHPQIASLSEEHEVFGRLLGELLRAIERDDRGAASRVAAELHPLLQDHAAREERGVFTQLRGAAVGDAYVARFERDHELVHELLAGVGMPDWQQPARGLVRALGEHIANEESDLFPAAHQLLTPAQWDLVDASVVRTTIDTA